MAALDPAIAIQQYLEVQIEDKERERIELEGKISALRSTLSALLCFQNNVTL